VRTADWLGWGKDAVRELIASLFRMRSTSHRILASAVDAVWFAEVESSY